MKSEIIVAFTGHRPPKLGGWYVPNPVHTWLSGKIEGLLLELKPSAAISGMALGADQWAAEIVLRMGIPLIAAVPFKGQESVWPVDSQRKYLGLLKQASEVVVLHKGGYDPKKMLKRNEWMVDSCTDLVAVWDGSTGGTGHCVNYAESVGRRIHRIDPTQFRRQSP
jgi:uncharacterized phage-like protein YoqJ